MFRPAVTRNRFYLTASAVVLCLTLVAGHSSAQEQSVRPGINKRFVAAGFKLIDEPTRPYFKDSYFLRFEKGQSN